MQNSRLQLARSGENLAAQYFLERGFQILARNFRRPGCELDLVLGNNEHLIILEVKTRRWAIEDLPSLTPPGKLKALFRGSNLFLLENPQFAQLTIHIGLVAIFGLGTEEQSLRWQRLPIWDDTQS